MEWVPTVQQTKRLLGYSDNINIYANSIEELRNNYAGKYIAIINQRVVLSRSEFEELIQELKDNYKASERSSVFIAYVPANNEVMIA